MMNTRIVELRSDTLSTPTLEMKEAMFEAKVGDDVYGEDPTVNDLEAYSAALFEKEAAVFMPTGTMSNLAAILAHCWNRGQEVFVGDKTHIGLNEQGGFAQFGGVLPRFLANNADGTFCLADLQSRIDKGIDCHRCQTALVCTENTHNVCNGSVLDLNFIDQVAQIAKSRGLKYHCDGARIFNAAVKLGVPVSSLTRDCDSVSFCLSKGLCCPAGSLLVGKQDLVDKARRLRKALGGGMRQAGFFAAPGMLALKTMVNRLKEDHEHAYALATAIDSCKCDALTVDLDKVQTNIVYLRTDPKQITGFKFAELMETPNFRDEDNIPVVVNVNAKCESAVRLVTHKDVSDEDINLTIKKLKHVVESLTKF